MSKHNGRNNEEGEGGGKGPERHTAARKAAAATAVSFSRNALRGNREVLSARYAAISRASSRVDRAKKEDSPASERNSGNGAIRRHADALFRLHEERRGANPIAMYTEKGSERSRGEKLLAEKLRSNLCEKERDDV